MSEPPNTPSSIIHHHQYFQQQQQQNAHHQPQQQQQQQPFISPCPSPSPSPSTSLIREYRKGNWTLHETIVLITAKKLDDERRTKASTTPPDPTNPNKTTTTIFLLLLRLEPLNFVGNGLKITKVREYEARSDVSNDLPSYWKLEKHERKERNLPTNLVSEVFEALNEVVHRRYAAKTPSSSSSPAAVDAKGNAYSSVPTTLLPAPPLPTLPPPPPPPPSQPTVSDETSGESSESDSKMKRRRKIKNVGTSILKSASVLAETIMTCEEKREKRHKDIIELEERRLQIEETRNEVNRQGIAGLISAVNNLSGVIQSLVSDRHSGGT
ncbi:hypothetical protein IFM89_007805 [Coptis chinensis]|uniref:Uncharacterized protein n=1 Tax=Coptis chinensis TaxID=261450 RepID=A0A835IXM0_9MAGN|nr:hypothetical protein IFM89_007805 [Coptis chinensis]